MNADFQEVSLVQRRKLTCACLIAKTMCFIGYYFMHIVAELL